jgi:DNA anti-recombination protein RmuC
MSGWLEAFIVVATLAIVIQMVILLAMFLQMRVALRQFAQITEKLHSRLDPLLVRINRIVEDSEDRIASVMSDTAEIARIARGSAQRVDRVFNETLERLRIQVLRADQILTGVLELVEDAGSKFRTTLWEPFQKASAILKGLKVGLDMIRGNRRRRSEPDPARQDEELFI